MAPSGVNDAAREMMAALKRWFNRVTGRADAGTLISSAGTSTAITVTYDTAPASLYTGLECSFKVGTTCGADPTLNVNSLGAKNIQKFINGAYANLIANDIVATQHVKVKYDGTLDKWILLGEHGQATITSGTYTPTLTNVTNIAASTAYTCNYVRVGSVVTVSGRVDIDPTSAAGTASELGMSLPIASDLAAAENVGGTFVAFQVAHQAGAILSDPTNNRASFQFLAQTTSNAGYSFHFTYRII